MGQYYKPCILGAAPTEGQHETVMAWMYSHDYDNGLKLMEHSYTDNNFVQTFEATGLTAQQAYLLARNSFEASFVPEAQRQKWLHALKVCFERFTEGDH